MFSWNLRFWSGLLLILCGYNNPILLFLLTACLGLNLVQVLIIHDVGRMVGFDFDNVVVLGASFCLIEKLEFLGVSWGVSWRILKSWNLAWCTLCSFGWHYR